MEKLAQQARLFREKLMADPYRPTYHFAIPDGNGVPGDANGAFYADGRYHLMYLYKNKTTDAFHWGHLSSRDLLHWRSHPDCLVQEEGDEGCFSGGAFVDDDGTAYLTFWKFPSKDFKNDNGGIDIAFARPPYDNWQRIRPLAIEGSRDVWGTKDITVNGETVHLGCADPSNIWKMNDMYYMQTGNLCVLNEYGRKDSDPAAYKGDWTELFKSPDLKNWQYVHRFYKNPRLGPDWPDDTEDDMCPSFLPLADAPSGGKWTNKWLQAFIAHNKGSQYYVGEMKGEKFYPELHGRFSWVDNTYFAPEALIDDKNRQISWSWLTDNMEGDLANCGWTGVFSFPRCFWYDGGLRMAPAQELDGLEYNGQTFEVGCVAGETPLAVKNGESCRIKAEICMKDAQKAGFALRVNPENGQRVEIYYDRATQKLVMDTANCTKTLLLPAAEGEDGRFKTCAAGRPVKEEAPFALAEGEKLQLDIFVDRSVIEVYANRRQAICRRAFPDAPEKSVGVRALSDGADFGTVQAFEMDATNLY